jgi:uncharacterized membrane protein
MTTSTVPNGSAMASFLGAGIGAFAMGAFVLLNETGLFPAPSLYAPAGGVSGRTTLAVLVWLIAWGVLHYRWKTREITPLPVYALTLVLIVVGIVATYPPTWALL